MGRDAHRLLRNHSNGDIFTCEDNKLFLHVKTSSFRAKAHLVFHWCLYNKIRYRVPKSDVIKMKFLKLWDLSGYSERTMSKRPTCQK